MNATLIIVELVALTGFVLWFARRRANQRQQAAESRHDAARGLCSRAQLVDGMNHIPVSLALETRQLSYFNSDFDAAVDLDRVDEVEYASDLLTGGIANGAVLRVRAHGRAIEFLLDIDVAREWSAKLPPHRMPLAASTA